MEATGSKDREFASRTPKLLRKLVAPHAAFASGARSGGEERFLQGGLVEQGRAPCLLFRFLPGFWPKCRRYTLISPRLE
jgi:hypothetical protein